MKFLRILALILISFSLFQCASKKEKIHVNQAFSAYISAYTTGIISVYSPIKIRFYEQVKTPQPISAQDFNIQPALQGKLSWEDPYTLVFQPEKPMAQNTYHKVTFDMKKLFPGIPDSLAHFAFDFHTIKQDMDVRVFDVKTYDKKDLTKLKVTGEINLADRAELDVLQQVFTARQGNKTYVPSQWRAGTQAGVYYFELDSVLRQEQESVLEINYDGKAIGVDKKDKFQYTIPALGDFKVIHHRLDPQNTQQIILQFSDPLLESQDLKGLIEISGIQNLSFSILDNQITVYLPRQIQGSQNIILHPGIQNIMGYKTQNIQELSLEFESLKPGIELLGDGVIVPNSQGLILPFKAVSLRAVHVKIIQIYENNMGQFLQVNTLNDHDELKRVGRPVYQGSIKLQGNQGLNLLQYNVFSLDIAKLITPQPGAMYHVELSFTQSQSIYPCVNDTLEDKNLEKIEENWDAGDERQANRWDEDYYDDYYYEDYDWDQRDNPCHATYYKQHDRKKSRNVFSSNLGIIAKRGGRDQVHVYITDLLSTAPKSSVKVEIFNYQQQLLGSANTDGSGMANIQIKAGDVPYYLKASAGTDRGYVRLDEGSSLSLSMFDVAGEITQKGLKGFIYGERGVWRPGDTLFLTFMVEDQLNTLQAKHPAVLELTNPLGQLYTKVVNKSPVHQFYSFKIKTKASDPTGNWTAKIKMGGALFTKNLKIETIKPNRLKIDLQFASEVLQANENFSAQLYSQWLHGAKAKNLKADIQAKLNPIKTEFSKFKTFTFDDPYKTFESDEISVYEGHLDEGGKAQVQGQLNIGSEAPGMLSAKFITRVYEEGGDFSIDQFSATISPYTSYVGIKLPTGNKENGMLLTDVKHSIDLASVDKNGKPIPRENLEVRIYKMSWQWWWENSGSDFSAYREGELRDQIFSATASTNAQGIGKHTFEIKYPDWGRYYVVVKDPESGHSCGQVFYADGPQWASRAQKENAPGATMLRFSLDKEKYNVGEKAKVTFPSSEGARALLTIENGSDVLQSHWVETTKDFTSFSIEVNPNMSPNVYVNITLVQPHANTLNDRPIRLYGMVPLYVEDESKKLTPTIHLPVSIRPEEKYTLKVAEKTGQAMTYTVAIVDEGLLGLTRFKTPDPYAHFYAKEALGVKSWDMYQYVLGALSGEMTSLLATGGDGEIINKNAEKAQRFKPVVKFLGPFHLPAGKAHTHQITLPAYVGAVRTMVIAGEGDAFGYAEKSTPVKKPLMLNITAPRVLSINESFTLPVTVFAMEKSIQQVQIKVTSNDFLSLPEGNTANASFKEIGDQVINLKAKTAAKIGICKITVQASSGKEVATETIEIDVRPPNLPLTKNQEFVLKGKESKDLSYSLFGIPGSNQAILEFSSVPPLNLESRLKYLIQYPHGCIEQTTSAVFPQLYLASLIDISENQQSLVTQNIKAGIARLQSFQTSEGGFAYWPGYSSGPDLWGTNYALHFLLEAEKKGYIVPAMVKNKALEFQKRTAKTWYYKGKDYGYTDYDQAYRLYTLALAGQADFSSMNRMLEQGAIHSMAKWKLAAAYLLAGQKEVAQKLIAKASVTNASYAYDFTYGSEERDLAVILECNTLLKDLTGAKSILDKLSLRLRSDAWMSTQTTAYSLLSIAQFIDKNQSSNAILATLQIEGKAIEVKTDKPIFKYPVNKPSQGKKFKVINQGQGILFVNAMTTGIPAQQKEEPYSKGLRLEVNYYANNQRIDISKLKQGTDFEAHVIISNTGEMGNLKELALTQVFPSGWEITNERFLGTGKANKGLEYQDIRDDRVHSYFDLASNQELRVIIPLHASYQGDFYLPAVSVEAMYDHNARANNTGAWVKVVE